MLTAIMGLGAQEILLILLLGVLLFGARKIPELGRSIGLGFKGVKEGLNGIENPVESVNRLPSSVEPEPVRPPQRVTTPASS